MHELKIFTLLEVKHQKHHVLSEMTQKHIRRFHREGSLQVCSNFIIKYFFSVIDLLQVHRGHANSSLIPFMKNTMFKNLCNKFRVQCYYFSCILLLLFGA